MSASRGAVGIDAILLDIEGTTTPIAFVYDVLFPYVRVNLRAHLAEHVDSCDYEPLFDRLREEHAADLNGGHSPPPWVDAPPAAHLDSLAGTLSG